MTFFKSYYRNIRKVLILNKKRILLTFAFILVIGGCIGTAYNLKGKEDFKIFTNDGSTQFYEETLNITTQGTYLISIAVMNYSNNGANVIDFDWNIRFNEMYVSIGGRYDSHNFYGSQDITFYTEQHGTLSIQLNMDKGESWKIAIYRNLPSDLYIIAPFFGSLVILGIIILYKMIFNRPKNQNAK